MHTAIRLHRTSWRSRGSIGSALSIGSVGSFASIGSVGSAFSIGSVGSAFSMGSVLSWASVGSLLSAASVFGVLAWRVSGRYRRGHGVGRPEGRGAAAPVARR